MTGVLDFDSGKAKVICFRIKIFVLFLIKNGYNIRLIFSNKNSNGHYVLKYK
jgi:hypothetical protein